ncbi:predicted protein [Nematostella vectensis]|uniref:Histamine N-methyltransferase n=1 Tax=Nematostella vectensis TaxID=45351 RepID=A7T1C5_NEMVE|nr:histamine N-methyltransferase A [Nematostella vectensis]EDO30243.1 predicted protein [Nematostella vectensis]|eukprot:XP_001622343.1 predicted protein [Nematostella vectensis]
MSNLSDLDHYSTSYRVFLKNCSNIDQSTSSSLEKNIPKILAKLGKVATSVETPLCILGVGSGKGAYDLVILQSIIDFYYPIKPCISETVVEPSESFIAEFRRSVAIQEFPDVCFSFQCKTFQEFAHDSRHSDDKFAIIHFIRSIYYVDLKPDLAFCYKNIQIRGSIVCVLHSRDCATYLIFKKLASLQGKVFTFLCGDDVINNAKEQDWEYEKFTFTYDLDATDVFKEESAEGNLLLDFLTHVDDFRKNEPSEVVHKMVDYIREFCDVQEDGKHIIKIENELIAIYKR